MPTRRALKRSLPRAYSLNSSGDMSTEPGHPLPALLRHNSQVVSSRLGDAGVRAALVEKGRLRAARWTGKDYVKGVLALADEFEGERRCWE